MWGDDRVLGGADSQNPKGIEFYSRAIRARALGCVENGGRVGIRRPQASGRAPAAIAVAGVRTVHSIVSDNASRSARRGPSVPFVWSSRAVVSDVLMGRMMLRVHLEN